MNFVDIESYGHKFRAVDPASYSTAGYVFQDELDIKKAYWSDLSLNDTVMDIGAQWGGYTLPALAQGAHVITVEPCSSVRGILKASVEANDWLARIQLSDWCLWDDSPMPPEFMADMKQGFLWSGIPQPHSLDNLVQALGCKSLSRIKMDVEGAELAILRSGRETLSKFRPDLIIEDHTAAPGSNNAKFFPFRIGMNEAVTRELESIGYVVQQVATTVGNPFLIARFVAATS